MDRPDPIPNSAVKRRMADGSVAIGHARVGCCQGGFKEPGVSGHPAFLVYLNLTAEDTRLNCLPSIC